MLPALHRPLLLATAALYFASVAPASAAPLRIAARPGASTSNPTIKTSTGTFVGQAAAGENEFLGIRYAEPPVGSLRWEPTVPAPASSATQSATMFGPHCPQPFSPFGRPSTTEDCLFLNVFIPPIEDKTRRLPVMVWFHGGAFVVGESDDYDPVRLVGANAIVVTVNYRLGALGFLAHPALDAEHHLFANYGLLDQQAALRWVQRNAAALGGDPNRITMFGESAGGASVISQLASPLAAGTFARAIVESGAYVDTPALPDAESAGKSFATAAGCTDQSAACLRALPVSTIIANEATSYQPTVDGTILPQNPKSAFASGAFSHVPVMNGSNAQEFRLFVALDFDLVSGKITPATYPYALAAEVGSAAAPYVQAEYPLSNYPDADEADAAALTDGSFACNALFIDDSLSHYVPTYAYEFADTTAPETNLPPVSFPYEAAHASEIQYLFNLNETFPKALNPAQQKLATQMVSYWTTFARYGSPYALPLGSGRWAPFQASAADMIHLRIPNTPLFDSFPSEHNCSFWQALLNPPAPTAHADLRHPMIRAR